MCDPGKDGLDNVARCHTETEAADQSYYLTQSQYTDTGPTSPCTRATTPDAWRGTHQGLVSWRPTTVKWRRFSGSNHHSTIGTRQTEYHEVLPSSANVQSHLTSSFADDGNASWYSVCRVPMLEWRLDCENCRLLTVIGLHDTGLRLRLSHWYGQIGEWSPHLQHRTP